MENDTKPTDPIMSIFLEHMKTCDTEFFLHESYYNNYRPSPPENYIAFRSEKRRIFVPNDLSINIMLQNLDKYIADGIVQELPLS